MVYVTAHPAYRALILAALLCYTVTSVSGELITPTSTSSEDKQALDKSITQADTQKVTGVITNLDPTTTTTSTSEKPTEAKAELQPIEQEIVALFKEFNDPKSTISWAEFCNKMSSILARDTKYTTASTTFKDLSQSTWSIKIIWKLSSLKKYLPSYISDLFKGYSLNNFRTMLNKRLALATSAQK